MAMLERNPNKRIDARTALERVCYIKSKMFNDFLNYI